MNPWIVAGAAGVMMTKRGRAIVRKGVVYGLAGAVTAGEALLGAARGAGSTAEGAATATGSRISAAAGNVKHGAEHLAGGLVAEARSLRAKEEAREPEVDQASKPDEVGETATSSPPERS